MHRIFSAVAALIMTAGTVAFGAPAHAARPAACETVAPHSS